MSKKITISFFLVALFGFVIYRGTLSNMKIAWQPITAEELERRLPPENFILIDVRQHDEYKQGHIPGAILMPLDKLEGEMNRLDPDEELIIYCYSGKRSARAISLLSSYGFANLKNLTVGIKGWKGVIEK